MERPGSAKKEARLREAETYHSRKAGLVKETKREGRNSERVMRWGEGVRRS